MALSLNVERESTCETSRLGLNEQLRAELCATGDAHGDPTGPVRKSWARGCFQRAPERGRTSVSDKTTTTAILRTAQHHTDRVQWGWKCLAHGPRDQPACSSQGGWVGPEIRNRETLRGTTNVVEIRLARGRNGFMAAMIRRSHAARKSLQAASVTCGAIGHYFPGAAIPNIAQGTAAEKNIRDAQDRGGAGGDARLCRKQALQAATYSIPPRYSRIARVVFAPRVRKGWGGSFFGAANSR